MTQRKKSNEQGTLYDVERDDHLEAGDAIYIYEDGTRELVKAKARKKNGK